MNSKELAQMSKAELIFHYEQLKKEVQKNRKLTNDLIKRVNDIQLEKNIYHSSDIPKFVGIYLDGNLDKYISLEMQKRAKKEALRLARSWVQFSEN